MLYLLAQSSLHCYVFAAATAAAVSVDAFVAGIAERHTPFLPCITTAVTYFACLALCLCGGWIALLSQRVSKYFGCALLFALGCASAVKKPSPLCVPNTFGRGVAAGFSVAGDGAAACLSLYSRQTDVLFLPLMFAAAHGIAVACGQRVRFPVKSPDRLSAVILFALCVLRLTL